MLILSIRPQNPWELFNLQHAQARNIIEHIFGVLKQRFQILVLSPEYNMNIQARIPAALAALHNFIHINEGDGADDIPDSIDAEDHRFGWSHAGDNAPGNNIPYMKATTTANAQCDAIAQAMWN